MVRTPNLGSVVYTPGIPPSSAAEMQRFLFDELQKLSSVINALAAGHLDKTHVAPGKPRDGDVRYADGTHWKPNGTGGAGIYYFNGAIWIQLG